MEQHYEQVLAEMTADEEAGLKRRTASIDRDAQEGLPLRTDDVAQVQRAAIRLAALREIRQHLRRAYGHAAAEADRMAAEGRTYVASDEANHPTVATPAELADWYREVRDPARVFVYRQEASGALQLLTSVTVVGAADDQARYYRTELQDASGAVVESIEWDLPI